MSFSKFRVEHEKDKTFFRFLRDSIDEISIEREFGAILPKRTLTDHSDPFSARSDEFM